MNSKQVLYQKDMDRKLSMASTTKIMTALIAIESALPMETILQVNDPKVITEGTSLGLSLKDEITLSQALYALMLLSANDVANLIAISISGDFSTFAEAMNQKAKQIGMENTNFITPSGLDDDEHFTTAYDMALLTAYAMSNPLFKEIVSSSSHMIEYLHNGENCSFSIDNHNKLLKEEGYIGVKTGFTKKSGRCLVSAKSQNNCTLICVTLCASDDWNIHRNLYSDMANYEVQNLSDLIDCEVSVLNSNEKYNGIMFDDIYFVAPDKINYEIYLRKNLFSPLLENEVIGQIIFNDKKYDLFAGTKK